MLTSTLRNGVAAIGFVVAMGMLGDGCAAPVDPGGGGVEETGAPIAAAFRLITLENLQLQPILWQRFWWLVQSGTGQVVSQGLGAAPAEVVALVSGNTV